MTRSTPTCEMMNSMIGFEWEMVSYVKRRKIRAGRPCRVLGRRWRDRTL